MVSLGNYGYFTARLSPLQKRRPPLQGAPPLQTLAAPNLSPPHEPGGDSLLHSPCVGRKSDYNIDWY